MSVIPIDWLLVPGVHTQLVKASAFVCFLSALRQTGQEESHEVEAVFAAHVVSADGRELVSANYCVEDVELDAERLQLRNRSRV